MSRMTREQLVVGREHLEEVVRLVRGLSALGFSNAEVSAETGLSLPVLVNVRACRRVVATAEEEGRVRAAAARLLGRRPVDDGHVGQRQRAAQRARWVPLTVETLERPSGGEESGGDLFGQSQWMEEASCAGVGGDAWFDDVRSAETARAVGICCRCPVVDECLAAALRLEEGLPAAMRFGVWGGLSPVERARMPRPVRVVAA